MLTQTTLTSGTLTIGQIILDAYNGTQTAQDCIRLQSSSTKYGVTLNGTKFLNCANYFVNGNAATKLDFVATDIIGDAPAISGGILLDNLAQGSVSIDGFSASNMTLGSSGALINVKLTTSGASGDVTASIKDVSATITVTASVVRGIWLRNIAGAVVENCNLTMNGLFNIDGINVQADRAVNSHSPIISGNTINHNGTAGHIIMVGTESSGPSVVTNDKVNNALLFNNRLTGSGNSSTLHGLMIGGQSNAIAYGNRVTNVSIAYLGKQDTASLFSGNEANQISGQAFRGKGSTNTAFINNSLYVSSGFGGAYGMYADDNTTTYSTGMIYKNNNIYSDVAMSQYFVYIPTGNDATFGGNNYYSTSTFGNWLYQGTTYNTIASWSSVKESNALSVNPVFPDLATSHRIDYTSPLYHTGVFYDSSVKDFNGNLFNNPPSVGAYEVFLNLSQTGPEGCSLSPPQNAPFLYKAIVQDQNSVLLMFVQANQPVDKYILEYGIDSKNYIYSSPNIGGEEINSYLVKNLKPNTKYYFRIRAGNGCAVGPWSDEISATTMKSAATQSLPDSNNISVTEDLDIPSTEEVPIQEQENITTNIENQTLPNPNKKVFVVIIGLLLITIIILKKYSSKISQYRIP